MYFSVCWCLYVRFVLVCASIPFFIFFCFEFLTLKPKLPLLAIGGVITAPVARHRFLAVPKDSVSPIMCAARVAFRVVQKCVES